MIGTYTFSMERENNCKINISKLQNSCLFDIIQKRKIFLLKMLQGHCLVLAALYSTNVELHLPPFTHILWSDRIFYMQCSYIHKKWGWKKWKGCAFLCKAPSVCVDTETGSNSISITPIFMNECNTFIFRDTSCYCLKKAGKRCRVLKDPNIHLGHLSRVEYQSKKVSDIQH